MEMFLICTVLPINQGFFKKNVYDQPQLMSNITLTVCLTSFVFNHSLSTNVTVTSFFYKPGDKSILFSGYNCKYKCFLDFYRLLTKTQSDLCVLWECRSVNKLMCISLSKHMLEAEKW